ncbi:MAG: response regulator [Sulfuricaulis sp.]|nr:response regulator [Sulfuricaulis sp.]
MINSSDILIEIGSILVVDDVQANLKLVQAFLEKDGFQIHLISKSSEVVSWTEINQPDLILLDIMMPDLNGIQVCERLKANPKTAKIPIIFLTARTGTENLVQGFRAGGADYVTKPFHKEELMARIRTHFQIQRLQKTMEKNNALLQESLEHIAHLKNAMLRICAWTKEVEVDGQWIPIDEYLSKHLGLRLTHGMSVKGTKIFSGEK